MSGPLQVFVPDDPVRDGAVWAEAGTLKSATAKGNSNDQFEQSRIYTMQIPPRVEARLFAAGWRHGLRGGQLTHRRHMRRSFREGFRASRLCLRQVRRDNNIVAFPMRAKVTVRARPTM